MGGDALTVLVVDDDPSLRLLCRVNFELDGIRVVEAGTVDEAHAALARDPVDVVLLDMHLGLDDGLSLVDAVRRERPAAAVALLTGSPEKATEDTETNVDAVFSKPFELDELCQAVRRLAGRPLEGRV